MPGREADFIAWQSLWERMDTLATALSRYKALNVNAMGLRQQAREVVQSYFGAERAAMQRLGANDSAAAQLDSEMQRLIGLSTGKNSKASYQKVVRALRAKRKGIETGLEFLIGAPTPVDPAKRVGDTELAIVATLQTMVPTAAVSYKQMLLDLQETSRLSYRGTAAELREVVREVLDHLAPDEAVGASPGFKLEANQKGPTMRQKVRFILRARKLTDAARQTAEDSVQHLDDNIASLGRSVYVRGSMDVHTARTRQEVLDFKLYANAVLGELLEIHKTR